MGLYAAGQVVFLTFPFSDLSRNKVRPVLLLAYAEQGDWVACQITSNPYIDQFAVSLSAADFQWGGLHNLSFVRPGKLFTANESLVSANVGKLTPTCLARVRDAVIAFLSS